MTVDLTSLSKRARDHALRVLLVERFPKCFAPEGAEKRPLAVGIRDMITERCPDLDALTINLAIRRYTQSPRSYRIGFFPGAPRIGLDGETCGHVSIEDARHAGERLMDAGAIESAIALARAVQEAEERSVAA